MRNYMPGPHRRFLECLISLSNLRPYILKNAEDSPVRDAYNKAVMSVAALRDKHMQLVARYIVLASKVEPVGDENHGLNLATATSQIQSADEDSELDYHGTGGTQLMPFLKETRDATRAAGEAE